MVPRCVLILYIPSPQSFFSEFFSTIPLATEQTRIVKDAVPVLEEHGHAITAHFYQDLLLRTRN